MNNVFLISGSNVGDRLNHLMRAKELITHRIGNLICTSGIYETEAWGYTSGQTYFNQCYRLESGLKPEIILEEILGIEQVMGRVRKGQIYTDRIIDIDILFFNDEIINSEKLTIPHPRLHERKFVLVPLSEIAGNFIHPVFGKSIEQLLEVCGDRLKVNQLGII